MEGDEGKVADLTRRNMLSEETRRKERRFRTILGGTDRKGEKRGEKERRRVERGQENGSCVDEKRGK